MKKRVTIIGGGASGLVCAIFAARQGADVTILEHNDLLGKKLLSTGNGRCNLTNRFMKKECFYCSQKDFPMKVIHGFPVENTLDFFSSLGILPKDKQGYIYPHSEQAKAVASVLSMEIQRLNIKVEYHCHVNEIKKRKGSGFQILSSLGEYTADAVVLAAGSKAFPASGSDGSGYELAKRLGHHIISPLPALVQLRCEGKHYKQLAGVRTEARLSLYTDKKLTAEETGELQLTDYGLSGIPTFQISRFASVALDKKQQVTVCIDFLPGMNQEQTLAYLNCRKEQMGFKCCGEFLTGVLNKKLSSVLFWLSGIGEQEKVEELSQKQWNRFLKQLKSYETTVTATNPYTNAQVCCGGVDTEEICYQTMESKLIPGFYITGELLDVDGICGGYNLQFAWSTGYLAGNHAGKGAL